jgi:ribosomal protein S18 acetylase RimI-like enzyme
MTRGDLRFAADLHRSCLGHGLFPRLGSRFLRAYLRTFVQSPFAIALVAERDGDPVGFLVGTGDDRRHYRHVIRRHGVRLALSAALALVTRPRVAAMFARTRLVRYARGAVRLARRPTAPPSPSTTPPGANGVLTHLAVVPAGRERGVGAALVEDFLSQARTHGAASVRLVTRSGESGAGSFYERLGWEPDGGFADADGIEWRRYRTEL